MDGILSSAGLGRNWNLKTDPKRAWIGRSGVRDLYLAGRPVPRRHLLELVPEAAVLPLKICHVQIQGLVLRGRRPQKSRRRLPRPGDSQMHGGPPRPRRGWPYSPLGSRYSPILVCTPLPMNLSGSPLRRGAGGPCNCPGGRNGSSVQREGLSTGRTR